MLPRFSPNYGWPEISQSLLPAPTDAVERLEAQFIEWTGHSAAVAFRYGRSGLYTLLKALGAKNRKVVMPSYTCMVVANAVVASGNQPVFLDNKPDLLQPDPADYLSVIDPETIMVIPTHLFGLPQETAALYKEIKQQFPHVFVLQDCAHSYFCKDSENSPVTLSGDGAIFGMNISKLTNSVHGGMLTLRDPALAEQIRLLHPWKQSCFLDSLSARLYVLAASAAFTRPGYRFVHALLTRTRLLDAETKYYDADKISMPKDFQGSMSLFEASIGLLSLRKYTGRIAERQRIAEFYTRRLQEYAPVIVTPSCTPGATWSHYPLLVPVNLRDVLKHRLERRFKTEIGLIVDYSVADMQAYQALGHSACPNARLAVDRILNLPLTYKEGLLPVRNWQPLANAICDEIIAICYN